MGHKHTDISYKDACTELRAQFTKGKKFKDSQNRQLNILDIPKGKNKAIKVEVITLSNTANEKRGRAKINMYEPKVKGSTKIMLTICSGYDFNIY